MFRFVSYLIVLAFTSTAYAADSGDIRFQDDGGKLVSLSEFKGSPVVLNLWATWCAPCVSEMPLLAKLQQQYGTRGLSVLALSEDDSSSEIGAFYTSSHITGLAHYFDEGHHVWKGMHISGIPTSFLIDRNGDVVKTLEGYVDWQSPEIQKAISELMAEPAR